MTHGHAELEQAFSMFTEASRQLSQSYLELQQQAQKLTEELAFANGELRRQYAEKAELSSRLTSLLQALPACVVELNDGREVIAINAAARRLLGDSVMGANWDQAIVAMLEKLPTPGEWSLKPADAPEEERILSVSESALVASGGAIVLLHDITESYRMQRQLDHQQRLVAMGEMAAGLAHQLRTPLATATLYCANLARASLGEEERIRFATRSLDRLRHLERLIQDMLRFVKGGQASMDDQVTLDALAAELSSTIEPQAAAAGVEFSCHVQAGQRLLQCDRKSLVGGVLNLLDNAIRACVEGCAVSLEVGAQGDTATIEVVDNGAGIPVDKMSRLFEPFFTTRSDGTGLGLAIVKHVIDAHGGRIRVESCIDEGSRFIVELPVTG